MIIFTFSGFAVVRNTFTLDNQAFQKSAGGLELISGTSIEILSRDFPDSTPRSTGQAHPPHGSTRLDPPRTGFMLLEYSVMLGLYWEIWRSRGDVGFWRRF